jgi:thioredoxin 1
MSILHLTTNEFNNVIAGGPVLVDFWAGWCMPCKMLAPVIEEIAGEVGESVKVAKLDVDDEAPVAIEYGVMSIPTVIIFKDGKEYKRFVGVQPKETYTEALAPFLGEPVPAAADAEADN